MKQTKEIERLTSITLLKIMLITGLFPWVLVDTGIILFHLLSGDFVVNYQSGRGDDAIPEQISLAKFVLFSYPFIIVAGAFFTILMWVPCAFSMWLWSKFSRLNIIYYAVSETET